jgi:hypothetical protein
MAIQKTVPGAYGADVAALQEFLRQQGFQLPASEVDRAFYGPFTRQAVLQYQQKNGLPVTGAVDESTANAINTSLSGANAPKSGPAGAVSRAVFPSAGTGLSGAAPPSGAIAAGSSTQQTTQVDNRGTVQGKLVDQDGLPIADTRVSVFAKLLRGEERIGTAQTDKQGQFSIGYERPRALNLFARAYDSSENVIAQSPVIFAAAATVKINFTTAADGIVRSPSIFTALQAKVLAQLHGTALEDLKENKDTHELRFLASAVGAQFSDVTYLFIAHVLAKQNKLRDETLFGIFEQGVPASLNAALANLPDAGIDSAFTSQVLSGVLSHSRVSLGQTLTAAVNANIVPASYAVSQDAELGLLDAVRAQSVRSAPYVRGKTPLNDLLNAGAVSASVQTAFSQAFADSGDLGATWKTLRTNPSLPAADLAVLQTTLQLGEHLVGNLALVKDTMVRLSQKTLSSVQNLALLDQSDWVARITALDPGATSIPTVIPGETAQQKITRLAKTLAKDFTVKYPTTAFQGGLAKAATSSFTSKRAITAFLGTNPKFELNKTNVDHYVSTNKLTMETPALKELKTAQRLFRLAPQYQTVEALKSAGYESAQSVYFKGRAAFLAHMTERLGSPSLAQATYAKAQMTYATALTAYGRYNQSLNGLQIAAFQSMAPDPHALDGLPDLQALFGSLDCFACEDCQSVYSPAAYLVDLLQYLGGFYANGGGANNARDALLLRRPDIQYIALSCHNTNTTLSYIDLVNEILEAAIAPPSTPVTLIDTFGSSAERRALPQQILQPAYQKTANTIFPLSLPFDVPFAQTMAYCAALHTSWNSILNLLIFPSVLTNVGAETIACASLGINPAMQRIIDRPNTENPWIRWGLTREFAAVVDPKNGTYYSPRPATWVAALNKVPVFLNRSGLSLQQLYQLLESVWVTQTTVTLQLGTTIYAGLQVVSPDTDDMIFTGLTGDVLDRANRFIRLWAVAGLQMWELDCALEHVTGALPMLDQFFVFLEGAKDVSSRLRLPFQEVLSFWMPLKTRDVTSHLGDEDTVVPSTYTEVFRNPAVLMSWGTVFVPLMPNTVTGASKTTPITITTALPHGYVTGTQVSITGVVGNTAAIGTFQITVNSPTTFTLNGSVGNMPWTSGGVALASLSGNQIIPSSASASPTPEQNAITTALALSSDDISAILSFTGASNALSLDTLNALLRYQRMASSLSLSASDLILWIQLTAATPFGTEIPITSASNAPPAPIVITTATPHGLQSGAQVSISGVGGNTAANGTFTITVKDPTTFILNGSKGNGNWTSGGMVAVNGPADTLEFLRRLAVLRGTRIALRDLDYLLRNQSASQSSLAFTSTQGTAVLQTVRDAIAKLPVTVPPSYDPGTIETIFLSALATATAASANVISLVLGKTAILPLDPTTIALLIGQSSGVDPTQFPSLINAFTSVAKAAALFSALKPTEAEFTFLLQNAATFGWLDPSALPIASTSQSPYAQFEALLRALKLNRRQPARTPKLFDVLGQWLTALPASLNVAFTGNQLTVIGATDATPPIVITTAMPHGLKSGMQVTIAGVAGNTAANGTFVVTVMSPTTFALNGSSGNGAWSSGGTVTVNQTSLALALNASVADITAIATALNATQPSMTPSAQPGSLADMAMLTCISSSLDVCARFSMSGATLAQLAATPATSDTASAARTVLQAQYAQDKWFAAIQPVEDSLRETRRDALVACLLGSWAAAQLPVVQAIQSTDDIFDYYLIDPEMSSCAVTTRLLEASLAIQQFMEQCFLNLKIQSTVDMSNTQLTDEWSWRKQYRLWQANREVFLYPENYLLPELRKNASSFFSDLENDLRQTDCNADAAESAIENYLRKLVSVSNLVVAAHYNQRNNDGSTILHVFAHTRGTPPQWFYRTRTAGVGNPTSGVWSAWESLNLDIGASQLIPVIWDRRLHLVWPIFKQISEKQSAQPVPAQGGGPASPAPRKFWAVEFAMSELSAGQWQPKRTFAEKMYFDTPDSPLAFTFQAFQDPSYNLQIRVYFDAIEECLQLAISQIVGTSGAWNYTGPWKLTTADFSAIATVQGNYISGWLINYIIVSTTSIPALVASATLLMPESPLSVVESAILPKGQFIDSSQEPTYSLITGLLSGPGNLPAPNLYGFSGQDLVFGDYTCTNPGSQSLNVLCTATANQQPISLTLLGSVTNPRIVIPQQEGIFDSADPFFIADPNRTYFVLPRYSTISSSPQPLPSQHSYGSWSTSYVFQTFYHPYARTFLRELEIGGVPQLMSRSLQTDPQSTRNWNIPKFDFNVLYTPSSQYVATPYPGSPHAPDPGETNLDFDPASGGAYSLYNWEIFYHLPMFVASLLMQNQKYQDAMTWLEYIFNPTDSSGGSAPNRYWEMAPLNALYTSDWTAQQIQNLLTTLAADTQQGISDPPTTSAITNWMADPFDPHAVASLRIAAYGKATVMKFLDNLIAWGDSLFSQYTAETVSQAEQLYIIADLILGPKPQLLRPPLTNAGAATYASLQQIDAFSNALVQVENVIVAPEPPSSIAQGSEQPPSLPQFPGNGATLLFCIPPNNQLLAYWDKVSQRLYNIRHCRNLQGVPVPLPLYAPPLNPLLLSEGQAGAAGAAGGAPQAPTYRFAIYLQKAVELTNDVRSFGALVLAGLEKQDGETLAALRASQEADIQTRVLDVKMGQVTEALDQITALQNQKAVVQIRYNFYSNVAFLNAWEIAALALQGAALIANGVGVVLDITAGTVHLLPTFEFGASGFGGTPLVTAKFGGKQVGDAAGKWAGVARGIATI